MRTIYSDTSVALMQNIDIKEKEIILSGYILGVIKTDLRSFKEYMDQKLQDSTFTDENRTKTYKDYKKLLDTVLYESEKSSVINVGNIARNLKSENDNKRNLFEEILNSQIIKLLDKGKCFVIHDGKIAKHVRIVNDGDEVFYFVGNNVIWWNQLN